MAQRLRVLTPARSTAHALGAELRRLRIERGLSQAQLGNLVHHSGALIGKIEKAERFPTRELCDVVDSVLRTGGRLSRMRPAADPRRDGVPLSFLELSWTVETSLRVLREVTEDPVDRREFLALTGTTLAALLASWDAAIAETSIGTNGGRLGAVTIDRLAGRLADLRVLDDELGGTVLRDLARAELRWLTQLAADAMRPAHEQQQILALITEAARLCGWLHLDADRQGLAQSFYVTALRCAADAADPLAGAHVLAGMSFQATLGDRTADALSMLDAAEQRVSREASPKLRALLASRRARAHARSGDARACGTALTQAESALDASGPGRAEPGWIYYFDEAELAAQAGACWTDLGRPERSRPLLDDALHSISPGYVRDRTIYLARSAQTHLHNGDLEPACDDLTTAAGLFDRTSSVRSLATIHEARRIMSTYSTEPVVRELDRTLARSAGTVA